MPWDGRKRIFGGLVFEHDVPRLAELSAPVAYDRQLFDTAQIVPPDEVGIVRFMISRTCP